MMKLQLTIDRFEDDKAVLKTNDGKTVVWPKNNLPKNIKEGSVLDFTIKENSEAEKDKKELAKEILNEILNLNGESL